MDSTRVSSILELPPEIQWWIVSLLSKRDLTNCVRVCKVWHGAFMDSLWHTVELKDASCYSIERPVFNRIKSLYRPHLVLRGKEAVASKSPFLRNLHRIRVLKVQYTSFLNLFWDQGPTPHEEIALENLSIDFEDNPKVPTQNWRCFEQRVDPIEMEAILQILGRSTRLLTFSFEAGVLVRKQQLEGQARLLAILPASLQRLHMASDLSYGQPVTVYRDRVAPALRHFLDLRKGDRFGNLSTLSLLGAVPDLILLEALVERSPNLEEFNLGGHRGKWSDSKIAKILSKVCSKGLKTIGFMSLAENVIGPLTVAAILTNSGTLENIRMKSRAFGSQSIQKLMCSAPNLKRLDFIFDCVDQELEPYSLMAMDVVNSTEDWVCLGLETFKCYIGGVPRPDITSKTNGRPLTGIYNGGAWYSMTESATIQRRILAQLGRLTNLREITLGKDVTCFENNNIDTLWYEEEMEEEYASCKFYQLGSQYQCLTMSLQDGLDELKDLKSLRRLTLEKMSLKEGKAEQTWMNLNWPEYGKESRDTFWTSRGHSVCMGSDLFDKTVGKKGRRSHMPATHDWW